MPKPGKSPDEQLRRLTGAKKLPPQEARQEIQRALASKSNIVVAKAADLARDLALRELIPALIAAFSAHLPPESTDKGCRVKIAIVRALHEMNYENTDVYERGIVHVQMEPEWGGSVDAAIPLRELSAVALAAQRHPRVLFLLMPLLVDPAPQVRAAAAQAIAATGREEAQLLLRLKALTGDTDEAVITECLIGLLQLTGPAALEFVTGFLNSHDPINQPAAALALAASRVPGCFDALHQRWQSGVDPEFAPTLLLALATMRDPRALQFLLSLIQSAPIKDAIAALHALKQARPDDRTRALTQATLEARNDSRLFDDMKEET